MRFRYSTEEGGRLVKKAAVYTQNEHRINFQDVDSHAVYITETLKANGYETYIVGGAVRDLILGKNPKDFDIVTSANPARIKKIFRNSRIIGRRFRLVHVFFGSKIFEVSTFRSLKDGPTSNTFGTIEEDVLRRDFSLNALFYDPVKQIVVDYVGGMKDIKKRLIRPIIDLRNIFTDDPVRMIRAVKYGAATGFKLPLSLKLRIRKDSKLLEGVSPSRLTEEINKIVNSAYAWEITRSLDALGLYHYIQPNAASLFKTTHGFKARYMETFSGLNHDGFNGVSGKALSALIKDYLEDTVEWEGSPASECYRNAFSLARKFVLPMNPPRAAFESAVKLLFAGHGIHIKKTRHSEYTPHNRPPQHQAAKAADDEAGGIKENDGKIKVLPAKKRRRRRMVPRTTGNDINRVDE